MTMAASSQRGQRFSGAIMSNVVSDEVKQVEQVMDSEAFG
jgi:hypothetical protein